MKTRLFCLAFLIALVVFLAAGSAWAAGLVPPDMAMPDMGTATAGRAALANDASTVVTNPAGMTRLNRSQMLIGIMGIDQHTKFDTDASTFGGGDGGDAGALTPGGSVHYVWSANDRFKLGVSAGSYSGLGLDYNDSWAGRYYIQNSDFFTFTVNPGAAYRVNDWLSVGAGVVVMYGELEQDTAVNNSVLDPGTSDGRIEADADDIDYGFNLGLLFEPAPDLRFGIAYRSEIELDFDDALSASGLGWNTEQIVNCYYCPPGTEVDLTTTLPQAVMMSGYYQANSSWAIMANVGWQDWSEFDQTHISIQSASSRAFSSDLHYDDTWHVALGAHYRINPQWLWMVGVAYDSSPLEEEHRSPIAPLDRTYRYATGLQYGWRPNISLGGAYEFLDLGKAEVDVAKGPLVGSLSGEYDTNYAHAFSLYMTYTF